jgi:hypothetical protein
MPLTFDSLSHGKIAFGFFNIETDLLLLNRYFFFASDFCTSLIRAIDSGAEEWQTVVAGYIMEEDQVGNLMGAIHGFDFRGFIGEVYRLYPFPQEPDDFRQNPEGFRTRSVLEQRAAKYGQSLEIPIRFEKEKRITRIGDYCFDEKNFQELVFYVWRGGYPRWRDDRRPDYVEAMKRTVEKSDSFPFRTISRTSSM